jgi:antitoxin component of MazEF toxin-antitoxin module
MNRAINHALGLLPGHGVASLLASVGLYTTERWDVAHIQRIETLDTIPKKEQAMNLLKQRKGEDPTTAILPAEIIEALHLAEDDTLAWETNGDQIVLSRATPEVPAGHKPESQTPSLAELIKLPLEERHRLLAAAAAEAAEAYRTNPELMEFSAALDGEDWEETDG